MYIISYTVDSEYYNDVIHSSVHLLIHTAGLLSEERLELRSGGRGHEVIRRGHFSVQRGLSKYMVSREWCDEKRQVVSVAI